MVLTNPNPTRSIKTQKSYHDDLSIKGILNSIQLTLCKTTNTGQAPNVNLHFMANEQEALILFISFCSFILRKRCLSLALRYLSHDYQLLILHVISSFGSFENFFFILADSIFCIQFCCHVNRILDFFYFFEILECFHSTKR